MPSRAEIVSFDDSPPPPGANPWVVTDPDPAWPRQYDSLAGRIREALAGPAGHGQPQVPVSS
jgi:hypothetical protein